MADTDNKPPLSLREMGDGPTLGIGQAAPSRRDLDSSDYRRSRIGEHFANMTIDFIQDQAIKPVISRYMENVTNFIDKCMGLAILGESGVGKTSIACMVALEAMRRGKTAIFITHPDLHGLRFDSQDFGDGMTLMERVKFVDLLVIDGFNESFLTDKAYGPHQLEELVRYRNLVRKPMIFTTRISPDEMTKNKDYKSLISCMRETMGMLSMVGEDLRLLRHKRINRALGIVDRD